MLVRGRIPEVSAMIIGTRDILQPGEILTGDYRFTEHEDIVITLRVLGPSTYEAWREYRASQGRPIVYVYDPRDTYHFYEVHTD